MKTHLNWRPFIWVAKARNTFNWWLDLPQLKYLNDGNFLQVCIVILLILNFCVHYLFHGRFFCSELNIITLFFFLLFFFSFLCACIVTIFIIIIFIIMGSQGFYILLQWLCYLYIALLFVQIQIKENKKKTGNSKTKGITFSQSPQ